MPDVVRQKIPNAWWPRSYQLPLWNFMLDGGKRAVAVWHRRSGKDSVAINWTARAAFTRTGVYWHMLPEGKQGRKVIWDSVDSQGRRVIDQAFPPELRAAVNDQEMKMRLSNGSIWQVVGSDNYDSLVGGNPVGIVFSEYAVAKPSAWDYIRPILAENEGWAIFIYTPRGRNHGFIRYELAKQDPDWFAEILTVEDTKAIDRKAIDEERRAGMPEDMIEQEFYCSFSGVQVGSYYGEIIKKLEGEGQICPVPFDPDLLVYTGWDLGMADSTSIWFAQVTQSGSIRIIDHYKNQGLALAHYIKYVKARPYIYGAHFAPHDVQVRDYASGLTRVQTAIRLGLKFRVNPLLSVSDGIDSVRQLLPKCWFDEKRCDKGLESLRSYHREWDDRKMCYADQPFHDWSSHDSDAFRALAIGLNKTMPSMKTDYGRVPQKQPWWAKSPDKRPNLANTYGTK